VVKTDIKEQAQQAMEEARQKGREVADQAQDKAADLIAEQQHRLAGQIGNVASALQNTARQLDNEQAWLAHGAENAAQSLNSMAGAMRDKDFSTLVNELERYTRQQPAVVLGGAAIAGFLLTRFLKSSTHHAERDLRDNRYTPPNY
jgi:ABC-type transporter Mla subunit MlaD